jgi:hypothetical protein
MSDNLAVYTAINAITADLAKEGIAKERRNQSQNFLFRGIDDVYAALAPLLSEHHLCILPRVVSRDCEKRTTSKGTDMYYTFLVVDFDFVSAVDGSHHTATTIGEASDSGDKSSSKAMSSAYKYACFQTFCIPTEGDNDAENDKEPPIIPPAPKVPLNIDTTTEAHQHLRKLLALHCGNDEAKIKDTLIKITAYTGNTGDFHGGVDSFDKITTTLARFAAIKLQELMKPKADGQIPPGVGWGSAPDDSERAKPTTRESLLAWLEQQTDGEAIDPKSDAAKDFLNKVNALASVAEKKDLMLRLAQKRAELGKK